MMLLAQRAANDFFTFIRRESPNETEGSAHTSVADFFWNWLDHGGAAKSCAKQFYIFLQAFVLVVEKWRQDPTCLRYEIQPGDEWQADDPAVTRMVERVVDTNEDLSHFMIFNPEYFARRCLDE